MIKEVGMSMSDIDKCDCKFLFALFYKWQSDVEEQNKRNKADNDRMEQQMSDMKRQYSNTNMNNMYKNMNMPNMSSLTNPSNMPKMF